MTPAESYLRGSLVTLAIVSDWTGAPPLFAFPPAEIGLLGDLRDIGARLARNDAARELLALLIAQCVGKTGHAPTAMMLLAALNMTGIAVERVSLSALGLPVGLA